MTAHADVTLPRPDTDVAHVATGHEQKGTDTALMGMLLFIASEIMFFAALFGAYFNVKSSAQQFLDRADAVLLHGAENSTAPAWKKVSLRPVVDRPMFTIRPPDYVTPEVVKFVRERLGCSSSRS